MIIRDREHITNGIPGALVASCIREHEAQLRRLTELEQAYNSKPPITERRVPRGYANNKLVHNYARYIVSIASGYLVGNPVSYKSETEGLDDLLRAYRKADIDSVDAELAKDASLFGRAVELCYVDRESQARVVALEPKEAFVVYSNEVDNAPLFGVRYYRTFDIAGRLKGGVVEVYTEDTVYRYMGVDPTIALTATPLEEPHYFGGVPVVEYWNNDGETGDFEHVLSNINAYDKLQSDRLNDKEQFVQSILLMTGARMEAEPDTIRTDGSIIPGRSVAQQIREDRMLFLPDSDAKAEYLIKQLSEADTSIFAKEIREDIHKFTMVPDLTDSQFAGNTSGVAMAYKLFGLEQLTKIKERWFKEGLRQRLRLMCHFLAVKGGKKIDADEIDIVFKRALPANQLELAQVISTLNGIAPKVDLLSLLPFINEPKEALQALKVEQAAEMKLQQEAFGFPEGSGRNVVDEGETR